MNTGRGIVTLPLSTMEFKTCDSFDPELENEVYALDTIIDENEEKELLNQMYNFIASLEPATLTNH